jgi:hypothetical protein
MIRRESGTIFSMQLNGLTDRRSIVLGWANSTMFLVASTRMSPRGSKNSQPKRSWQLDPPPPSTLDGLRSPSPSTEVTTQTLSKKLGRYPLVVCPIVKDVKLNKVLVDGGSSLNLLFLKTLD